MPLHKSRPLANGLRTDHPIPDLPFIDDSHIPLEDPRAIEAVGRHKGEGRWGREDRCSDGGWVAFTTDPLRHDLAWVVRWHPDHGRSVILYRDGQASSAHTALGNSALLFRSGGYWWDGTTWYRPSQVWDRAREDYVRRPVPGATTVTAADLLHTGGTPDEGRIMPITDLDIDAPPSRRWLDELAVWASQHQSRPLTSCTVKISAPELTADQLVGLPELADIGGVAASTLRAYISRGEQNTPSPQATISGRSVWARPVAEEWAEQRHRSPDSVLEALSTTKREGWSPVPIGAAEVWERFTKTFTSALWENPERRKRWALRWRTQTAVHEIADELGWHVGISVDRIIPLDDLASTVRHAVLHELDSGKRLEDELDASETFYYGIVPAVTQMLDWLIRHSPKHAGYTVAGILGEAERTLHIPPAVTEQSLRTALALDGQLAQEMYDEFFTRVFSPADTNGGSAR